MRRVKRFISKFYAQIIECLISIPFIDLIKTHASIIGKIEKKESVFITEHKRPVIPGNFSLEVTVSPRSAIVMQGPVIAKDNFTYETLKLYTARVEASSIILSTWENEDKNILKAIEDIGVTVCLNALPEFAGTQNINYQIASTTAGLIKARDMGAEYVLKTRTDQRIYSNSALRLFNNLLTVFPVTESLQKERLIISSLGTLKYRLYGAGDMLMYGNTYDMINYWNVDMDMRKLTVNEAGTYTIKDFSKLRLGEMYFCSRYFEKLGYTLDWTLKQSWELLAAYFCVVDHSSIDLYWPKYDLRNEFRYHFYVRHSLQQLTFSDWLSLYLKQVNKYPEEYLTSPFGKQILL